MPGVNITTAVRTGPAGTNDEVASQVFMVGTAERGPAYIPADDVADFYGSGEDYVQPTPVLLRSFNDFTTYYGNYEEGSLYAHVKTFFDEGGSRCYVQRVVGSDPSKGTVNLTTGGGSAVVMTVTAKEVGDWSSNVVVNVLSAGTTVKSADGLSTIPSFRLSVSLDGVGVVTSRDFVNVTDAANFINSSPAGLLIEATVPSPAPTQIPDVDVFTLSAGDDGASVSDAQMVAALDSFSSNLKSGAVCIPGKWGSTIWEGIRDHAAANNRIAILGFDPADSAATARSTASSFYNDDHASYMAFYWPSIKVAGPNSTEFASGTVSAASTLTISPESYVAAARAKAVVEAGGPWRAGAGLISKASTILGLSQDVTAATGEVMDAARVNVIRNVANSIRVYGARSISADEANWRYITMRDTMNYISVGVEDRMEDYVFSTIDTNGSIFGLIRASIKAFLDPIRVAGGLYEAFDNDGVMIDPGYNVVVGSANNPVTQLATGLVKAEVGVRVSSVADLISIVITKSNLSAPLI